MSKTTVSFQTFSKQIASIKRRLVQSIKRKVEPLLYVSRYTTGPIDDSRPLKLYVFRADETTRTKYIRGVHSFPDGFEGFTGNGLITDSHAGGLVTSYYSGMPVEDLLKLDRFVDSFLSKLKEAAA